MKKYFKTKKSARTYQNKIKRLYGYRPSLFIVHKSKRPKFMIIKPKTLRKLI